MSATPGEGSQTPLLIAGAAGLAGLLAVMCMKRSAAVPEADAPAADAAAAAPEPATPPRPTYPTYTLGECVRSAETGDDHHGAVGKVVDTALATSDPAKVPRVGVKFHDGKVKSVKADQLEKITTEDYDAACGKGKETQKQRAKEDQQQRLSEARERAKARAAARKKTT